jgi:hypothetical protein
MNLATDAVNAGLAMDALQKGIRVGTDNQQRGASAREGNSKKAAIWHHKAEQLTHELWGKRPNFRGNASSTAQEIQASLKAAARRRPGRAALQNTFQRQMSANG